MDEQQKLGAVRAKMQVNRLETTDYGQVVDGKPVTYAKVHMGAVYGKEGENADYAKATPCGECWLQIDSDRPASGFFKPGKRYYVTFTEAPD